MLLACFLIVAANIQKLVENPSVEKLVFKLVSYPATNNGQSKLVSYPVSNNLL